MLIEIVARCRCLASQEIRSLVERGIISGGVDESNIQPSSLEPTIGDEVFVLDTDSGLFRPRENQSVYRALLELPKQRRIRASTEGGVELRIGGTYLFHLNEGIRRGGFDFIRSSPKSSMGRVFPSTRFMMDNNPSYDEATNFSRGGSDSWLLVQPTAFNFIVGPGMSFNQLRFFRGYDAALSPQEIIRLWEKEPLLFSKGLEGELGEPIIPRVAEALQLHLDLEGRGTESIVALKARKNPEPVDLRRKASCVAEHYFEPITSSGGDIIVEPGQHYLMASQEALRIPARLNSELRAHSHQGIRGTLHEAGFIDNGFHGDLVLEVTSEEPTPVRLTNGVPIGELVVYRTKFPDKLYGRKIGSNYAGQTGPKVAKYFTGFDYAAAAKNHARLNRDVLTQDKQLLGSYPEGFNFLSGSRRVEKLFGIIEGGFFHSRYDCENDGLVVQPIPYILLFDGKGGVFSYQRATDPEKNGDERLFGNYTVGLGGHIQRCDALDYVRNCVNREIEKDVSVNGGVVARPRFLGTLNCADEKVDNYHFGLVFGTHTDGVVSPRDSAISLGRMVPIGELGDLEKYESWSRCLIPHLSDIEKKVLC